MTKKLEELFELPENNVRGITISLPENMEEITTDTVDALDKIEAALPQVRGLEASDTEMDELARLATDSYKDLMDLGMQINATPLGEGKTLDRNELLKMLATKTTDK